MLPSLWESAPLVILEAMELGCCVIATDVGAVSELIENEETGFLVPLQDADIGILTILNRLDGDRQTLKISVRLRLASSKHSWANSVKGLARFQKRSINDCLV